jgi:VanZ family protein
MDSNHQSGSNGFSRWGHRAFIAYMAVMLMAFLLPIPNAPQVEAHYADKLVHLGIFFGFALLFWMDQRPSMWWTLAASWAFAGIIELLQGLLPYRDGDWLDFAAGALGATLGTLTLLWLRRRSRP